MKKQFFILLAVAMFLIGTVSNINALTFYDSFGDPTFDPFWTEIRQDNGTVALSFDQVHSGVQSAKFDHYSAGGQKDISLGHIFPEVVSGEVSVWFYDTRMGEAYSTLTMYNSTVTPYPVAGSLFSLGVMDWDNSYYFFHSPDLDGAIRTSVQRTIGWHEFKISMDSVGGGLYIDDTMVNSFTGDHGFDSVYLSISGPRSSNATYYYDDFSITASAPIPEPCTMFLLGTGLIGMVGVTRRKIKRS